MASTAFTMSADRSSGRQSTSEPLLARPIGVRAVATITASGMAPFYPAGGGWTNRGTIRAVKFGLLPPYRTGVTADPSWITAFAKAAEASGFESLYVAEHVVVVAGYTSRYPYSDTGRMTLPDDADIPDPLDLLAFVAGATTTLGLGTGILVLPEHHPVQLAKRLATIDRLSNGRLVAGVGVGWLREEIEAMDIDPSTRGARTDECIEAMRVLWRDDEATFHGRFFHFERACSFPKPRNRTIPIHVGGHSRAAAERAGPPRGRLPSARSGRRPPRPSGSTRCGSRQSRRSVTPTPSSSRSAACSINSTTTAWRPSRNKAAARLILSTREPRHRQGDRAARRSSRRGSSHERASVAGQRAIRYGMQLPVQAQSTYFVEDWEKAAGADELAAVATACDESGFDYVAVCDHVAIPRRERRDHEHDLVRHDRHAELARRHSPSNVRLLSHVFVPAYRHPLQTAKAFSTLDALSNGRAILGVGAGHVEAEFDLLGISFADRGKLTDEALDTIRAAFADEWGAGDFASGRARSSPVARRSGSADRHRPPSGGRPNAATDGFRRER